MGGSDHRRSGYLGFQQDKAETLAVCVSADPGSSRQDKYVCRGELNGKFTVGEPYSQSAPVMASD
jgi:hypothetical protein